MTNKPNTNIIKISDIKNRQIPKLNRLKMYLNSKYIFRYNTILNRVELSTINSTKFREFVVEDLWEEINTDLKIGELVGLDFIKNLVASQNFCKPVNSLLEWLNNLEFDESKLFVPLQKADPIAQYCAFIELENNSEEEHERLYKAMKKWLISAIKCVLNPFYVPKQMLVFTGPSGIGKTAMCKAILPVNMKEYMKSFMAIDSSNKDAQIALTSSFVGVIDEIDEFFKNQKNRQAFKAYLSTNAVKERLPYGRTEVTRRRFASFLGTCNESHFLNDPTGTQRFVVFAVANIINDKHHDYKNDKNMIMNNFPVDQLWAWAWKLYKEGEIAEYTTAELELNERKNDLYKFNSTEYETLIEYLEPASKEQIEDSFFLTSTQILKYLKEKDYTFSSNINSLGKALIRAGFKKEIKRVGKNPVKGYWVKKINSV